MENVTAEGGHSRGHYTRPALRLLPTWLMGYRREWLVPDVLAGVIVWSVVVPQAVAYAQIAGLPPSAGLAAAPGALLAYAWLGTSRTLVVSATTATSALSAAAVGPVADGDTKKFAALSAALALIAAVVLAIAGFLKLGGVMDFVSKPVMTGFLFGLGLTVTIGQLPKIFGVAGGSGHFFHQLRQLIGKLDETSWWTLAVGTGSIAALIVLRRVAPKLPGTLIVLAGAIVVSALLDLKSHGVDVVGDLPSALPDPSIPDVGWADLTKLVPAALGLVIVTAEAIGVARGIASTQGYAVDVNRDLVAFGGSNLLAGLSSGFVQSGGASQTMAAERSGGQTQLLSVVAAGLILLTGAFLAPLFEDLPQATLAAIVVVAIASFFRVDELRRYAHVRRSALGFALVALIGVLVLGVLPGLLIAAALSLVWLMKRLGRPPLATLARDPATGAWGHVERHPGWSRTPDVLVVGAEGPLFYANALTVKDRIVEAVEDAEPRPVAVVLDLSRNDEIDIGSLDMLADLVDALARDGVELRFAAAHAHVLELLERDGFTGRVRIEPTLDAAIASTRSPR
jgi:sulfate permease, SulP family